MNECVFSIFSLIPCEPSKDEMEILKENRNTCNTFISLSFIDRSLNGGKWCQPHGTTIGVILLLVV